MDPELNEVVASSDDVVCPTCNAEVGKRCVKRFTDWPESIPHETRVEAAGRLVPSAPEPEPEFPPGHFSNLLPGASEEVPKSAPPFPAMGDLFTRRLSSRNEASQRYSCALCRSPEVYRAIDNVPTHCHLCEGCWLTRERDEREHYERVESSTTLPRPDGHRPRVMRRGTEVMGFATLMIPPDSTSLGVVCPQWVVKPTHLYILVRSGERLQVSNLRIGHYEQLMQPVPVELFRPLSDEVVAELARKHEGDEDVFLAALSQHCRVDMGIAQIGNQIALGIKNPTDDEAVVDAAIKVYSNREVY